VSFSGDLKKLPLADVFQSVHQNQLTGALAIRPPERGERLVAFEDGLVVGCALPEGEEHGIAAELIRRKMVEDKDVRPSRFFRRRGNLKRTLKKRGLMQTEQFEALTRSLVLERIYDCFLLEEGKFEFLEKYDARRFDEDELAAGLKIAPGEILMEAMRRVDEWSRIRRSIPSFREVYVGTREWTDDDDPLVAEVLSLTASGTMDLDDVVANLPYPRFQCVEAVAELVAAGDLRVATAPEYLALGKAAEERGELNVATTHYRQGLTYERGNAELNRRLVEVLERQGRKQDAADERKRFAGALLEQGQRQAAGDQYARAAELAPADPLSLERLLDLQAADKKIPEAQDTARRLVDVYMQLGLGEKAKAVYPRLLMLKPRDAAIRERLADTHAALHENVTAATILKELAQESVDRGDTERAIVRLRRAVDLVPDDDRAAALLNDLETGEHAHRRRRRRRYVLTGVGALVLAAAAGWTSYEAVAITYLRQASRNAHDALANDTGPRGILSGLESYQETVRWYPYTYAQRWGEDALASLTRVYVHEVERSSQQLVLPKTSSDPAPLTEVVDVLNESLTPLDGPRLEELIAAAEDARQAGEEPEARRLWAGAMHRADGARLALIRAGPRARKMPSLQEPQERLRASRTRLHLLEARLTLDHPRARQVLEDGVERLLASDGSGEDEAEAEGDAAAAGGGDADPADAPDGSG